MMESVKDRDDMGHRPPGGVQSINRAFLLLETLGRSPRPIGVAQLAEQCNLSLGTIHRLLRTLVNLGYVRQDADRHYTLGTSCIRLGESATARLAGWSSALLEATAQELGESVNLATSDNGRALYIAHVPSTRSIRTFTQVGSRVPLHSTGVGKALLSLLDIAEVQTILNRTGMPAATVHTITDATELMTHLMQIRAHGYAMDEQEQEIGIRCVAVPTRSSAPLAVSMSGPASRITDELVHKAIPILTNVARKLADGGA